MWCEEWKKSLTAKNRLMALKVKETAIKKELAITNTFMDVTRTELDNAVAEFDFHWRLALDPPCCSVSCVSLMATKEEYVESFLRGMDQTRKALDYRGKAAILKTTLARDVAHAVHAQRRVAGEAADDDRREQKVHPGPNLEEVESEEEPGPRSDGAKPAVLLLLVEAVGHEKVLGLEILHHGFWQPDRARVDLQQLVHTASRLHRESAAGRRRAGRW